MTKRPRCPVLRQDLFRYGGEITIKAFITHFVQNPGFRFTVWLRAARAMRDKGGGFLAAHYLFRYLLHRASLRYGIGISYDAQIGPGLYIGHYGGIVVHNAAIIGCDCNLNHGVTIGAKYGGLSPGVPRIGDRVYLGPGCKVIGAIELGSDVAVGANCVVTRSAPDKAVVVGVPGRIISYNGSGNYVVNTSPSGVGLFPECCGEASLTSPGQPNKSPS